MNNSPQQPPPFPTPPWQQKGVPQFGRLKIEIEGKPRHFISWFWEGRIYFQDKECPRLIWGTLETWDETVSLGVFWREAIRTRNVGRYVEVRLNLLSTTTWRGAPYNSNLMIGQLQVHALLDEHNGGVASLVGSQNWHKFGPYQASRVTRPHAWKPSIFSPRRHVKFASQAVRPIEAQLVREKLSHLQWEVWQEGANYRPLRLIATAFWAGLLQAIMLREAPVISFWQQVLQRIPEATRMKLPPEMNIEGRLDANRNYHGYPSPIS